MEKRLFSGIQPTGELHIGNYLGAIKNWVALIEEFDCVYCVVDYHAITIEYDPAEMPERVKNAAATLIGCGIDPDRCKLFVQSHVPEHTELAWIFNTVTPMGELSRMTQFKEKAKQHEENVNVGLFDYPVLQAADIVLYKAIAVPVGEDQVQHIEFCREVVRQFNRRYGEVFPEPKEILAPAARIKGLDGQAKMSKSLNNYIGLLDEPDVIRAKLKRAFTVQSRLRKSDPGDPDACNIFTLHGFFSTPEECEDIREQCLSAELGCVDCKARLAENMIAALAPIRERTLEVRADEAYLERALRKGAEQCREIAQATMAEVRKAMGLR